MVTDDVYTDFAEHKESIIALIVDSIYGGIPGDRLQKQLLASAGWDGHIPPTIACNRVVFMLVVKGSLSEERGTFASLVIIQTLKIIPRARSSPRSRCARKRIGMGSSASINFPSRNDEATSLFFFCVTFVTFVTSQNFT